MGCFPANSKNKFLGEQETSHVVKLSNATKHDLKITEGMLVQEADGDPYQYFDETKLLGEGSFGQVYKVIHKVSKVTRAMKIINKAKAAMGDEDEKTLINEITILKSLDHPNIIKVYEYFNTKRKLFIVSELCTGGELFDKITLEKHFSEKVAAHVMKQLFSAVQFCHSNNIIHRDLKPENILIESDEEAKKEYFTIKIIDFGTSDKVRKNKMLDKQIGTPFYIAPEVLNNSYNEKCDLWSCGVIMYILLCGIPPFYGETDEEIYDMVKQGIFTMEGPDWEEVSSEAKELIKCLLKKDMGKRISAEDSLKHDWFKKMKALVKIDPVTPKCLKGIVFNLKGYAANQKLQQATLAYIVHNLTKKEDVVELRKCFMEFDENADGRLTKEELIKGLTKVMSVSEATREINRVIEILDVDGNGYIEYEEFLRATLNKEKIITKDNLLVVFDMFDRDKRGKITPSNLKQVLGKDAPFSDDVWKEIISETDLNGDGEVSFNEFTQMMNKVVDGIDKDKSIVDRSGR